MKLSIAVPTCLLLALSLLPNTAFSVKTKVDVSVDKKILQYIPPYYLGVTLDSCFIKYKWCHINWLKAIKLARFLGPGILRVGGTDADYLKFVDQNQSPVKNSDFASNEKPRNVTACSTESMFVHWNFAMTASQLDTLTWFARNAGWRLIFNLNLAFRKSDGFWNPNNALQLLKYADKMNYSMDFELGNEMNGFGTRNISINGSQVAQDYKTLRKLLDKFHTFNQSLIVGPAVGSFTKILKKFLKSGGGKNVYAVTLHQYYGDGRSGKINEFLDPKILDGLKNDINDGMKWVRQYYPKNPPEVWYGETSSMYHGGAKGLSDRYVAGFMWLDKLGMSAKLGIKSVIRQTFFMGNYAMIDPMTNPNPNFWLSAIFKRLVGPIVLNVNATVVPDSNSTRSYIRFYGHCQQNKDLTVYGMNLLNSSVAVSFPQFNSKLEQYLLEPEQGNLTTKNILLNGKRLQFKNNAFSKLAPVIVQQPVTLPAKTFVFYVLKKGCQHK